MYVGTLKKDVVLQMPAASYNIKMSEIGHVFDGKIFFILTPFLDGFLYSVALAQDRTDR